MATQPEAEGHWSISPRQLLWKLTDSARHFRERQTLSPEAALGRRGEDQAHRYLQSCGLTVVAREYDPNPGQAEVDIVARDGDTVRVVEVKARRSDEFPSPERAIDQEKRNARVGAARAYCT